MTNDFEALTVDELYLLRLEVAAVLRKKLVAKQNALERLQQLSSETWSGRANRSGKSRK